MFHIPKPAATCRSSTNAHRGILVQPVFGKALHRAVRALPIGFMEQSAPALQLGSRKGKSHVFGFFMSRGFVAFSKALNVSAAIIFLDLQAAYYAVVRELIMGPICPRPRLRKLSPPLSSRMAMSRPLRSIFTQILFCLRLTLRLYFACWPASCTRTLGFIFMMTQS